MEELLADSFYVDDLLASQLSEEDDLSLINNPKSRLERYDLNMCKFKSNANLVRKKYPHKEPLPDVLILKENNSVDELTLLDYNAVYHNVILADDDRDSLEDDDRFEEYYYKEDFEDFVQDIRRLFPDLN